MAIVKHKKYSSPKVYFLRFRKKIVEMFFGQPFNRLATRIWAVFPYMVIFKIKTIYETIIIGKK